MALALRHRALTVSLWAGPLLPAHVRRGGGGGRGVAVTGTGAGALPFFSSAAAAFAAGGGGGGSASASTDLCSQMVSYARHEWRRGERGTAVGVLEHGADLVAKASEGGQETTAASAVAASRTHLAWAVMQADAGELSHAHDTLQLACDAADGAGADAAADRVAAHAAAAVNAARALAAGPAAGLPNARADEHVARHLRDASAAAASAAAEGGDGVALRVAAQGARGLAAMATGNTEAADAAVADVVSQLRSAETETEEGRGVNDALAHAANLPHGAAVAAALKAAAHWTALCVTTTDGADADATTAAAAPAPTAGELYARAAKLAEECAASPAPAAVTSALMADELVADIKLGAAQLALRAAAPARKKKKASADADAGEEKEEGGGDNKESGGGGGGGGGGDALAAAEEAAAEAVMAAEALGYGEHPRVGLAVACSGDVYTAKAARWGVAHVELG